MAEVDIGVIIVNWKQDNITRRCLDSLKIQAQKHFVILIENECQNSSAFENESGITVVKNTKNLGYSKAINQGVEVALKQQPLALLLLNNDAYFENDKALSLMLEPLLKNDGVGAVAAAIVNQDLTYVHKWSVIHPWLGPEFIGMNAEVDPPGLYQAEYLSACCLLIRRETMAAVGAMDERFFIYFEDIDWSHRARQEQWQLLLQTAVRVFHYDSFTANQYPKLKYYQMGRSRCLFLKKHYRWKWKFFLGLFAYYFKNVIWNKDLKRAQVLWEFRGFMRSLFL